MMGEDGEIAAPSDWESLEKLRGTVFLLGGTDSGKSTLARWLSARLAAGGERVGWIDGDVGQSSLGVPTTLNLALVDADREVVPALRFFVGSTSPRGHMLPVVVGLHRLAEGARNMGCRHLVIDTDGLVDAGAGGGALKEWQMELLRPGTVIAVQGGEELAHLLSPLRRRCDLRLQVLSPSPHVRTRSAEERRSRRGELFRAYFANASSLRFPLHGLAVYGMEKVALGRLLSFQDRDGFSLALGILQGSRPGEFDILTPLQGRPPLAALRLGDLLLDPATGEEI